MWIKKPDLDSINSVIPFALFALFIATSFSLCWVFFRLSSLFSVLIILGIALYLGVIIGSYYQLKKHEAVTEKRIVIYRFLVLFAAVWIFFQLIIIGGLQYEYSKIADEYSNYNTDYLSKNPDDHVNASWDLTEKFYNSFFGTYGVQGTYLANRALSLQYTPYINPILDYYFNNMNGLQKMIIIQRKGNCGEFSQSIAFLLNDTAHSPTRLISIEGIDHMMPEVNINNRWWVFDKVFLTPSRPIETQKFSNYVQSDIRDNIANIYSQSDSTSLLKEHGFNKTIYTITAISDPTGNISDDMPLKEVNIEIFTLNNTYDPMIAKGTTNENGQFSTVLNSDKDYWVIARYEPLPIFPVQKLVGITPISQTTEGNRTVNVYLHKYE